MGSLLSSSFQLGFLDRLDQSCDTATVPPTSRYLWPALLLLSFSLETWHPFLPSPCLERKKTARCSLSLSYPAKIADWWVKPPIREKQTIATVSDRNHRASERVGGGKEACTRIGQFRKGRLAAFKSSKFRSELLRVWGTVLTKSS